MKSFLSPDELITHMKSKGIGFNLVDDDEAKTFMQNNNYYMKLAAYRFNYDKYPLGHTNEGKYRNLEFAYLQELSTIDMHLRYIIFEMCLDIEHILKVKLLSHAEGNEEEDGYNIIRRFINANHGQNERIIKKIKSHTSSEYCRNLIDKYHSYYPLWVFVELISFGDLTYLCEFYNETYGYEIINNKFLNTVRDMRNASAHSNCMINRLFDILDSEKIDARIIEYIKSIKTIGSGARNKNLKYRVLYDFVTLIYVYDNLVESQKMKEKRYKKLKKLFNERMIRNKDFFKSHTKLLGVYTFAKKVVDNL